MSVKSNKDPEKQRRRFDGLMAWSSSAFAQFERKIARQKQRHAKAGHKAKP